MNQAGKYDIASSLQTFDISQSKYKFTSSLRNSAIYRLAVGLFRVCSQRWKSLALTFRRSHASSLCDNSRQSYSLSQSDIAEAWFAVPTTITKRPHFTRNDVSSLFSVNRSLLVFPATMQLQVSVGYIIRKLSFIFPRSLYEKCGCSVNFFEGAGATWIKFVYTLGCGVRGQGRRKQLTAQSKSAANTNSGVGS